MTPDEVQAAAESLVAERTVDIVTTGRRSGESRATEIWTTVVDGEIYVCGTPGASQADIAHQPRDWLANLLAEPAFTLRLKSSVRVELAARATPVTDRAERERIMRTPQCAYYRENSRSFDDLVDLAPMVRVDLVGDAAAVASVVRAARGNSPH